MRVGIIGAGGVGVELMNYLLTLGNVREIVLVNRNKEKALGEVADFSYVESFTYARNTHLHSGSYADCAGCDVIVITAGAQLKGNQTRDELLGENALLIREIVHTLHAHAPHAILIMVTNPVDVLTHIAYKEGLYPRERLISAGTLVDTARFMKIVSQKVGIDPKNINGYILGEHGKGSTLPWSICNICGLDVDTFCSLNGLPLLERAQIYRDVINGLSQKRQHQPQHRRKCFSHHPCHHQRRTLSTSFGCLFGRGIRLARRGAQCPRGHHP